MFLRAYAKINLGLRIIGRRHDGYHDIETIFHRVNVFDELMIEPSTTISLVCNDPNLPTDDRNLCVRAAKLLQQRCAGAGNKGVQISLTKKIPIGAGLGGGSSDAAALLRGLVKLRDLHISEIEMHSLAEQLGSDTPYFLRYGSAYATARGNVLEYFHLDIPYWIVLVYPTVSISTTWAYKNVQRKDHFPRIPLMYLIGEHIKHPDVLRKHVHNDFEPLVLETFPEVARAKQSLLDAGAIIAQLSGSGSSVFGFFTDESTAQRAIDRMPMSYEVFLTAPHFQPNDE